ncbi:YihY/virulence factor BrkB family protein [Nitratireductor thuwali]|uniref:YihY/virulence factor BrkB family protein n=1 Tax=Nitratireductor thuwali TaxID=2267699 RepID=A0ABY5MHI2_9HYPH|nr:hypothetical protein NTH_01128 [Nitratireductor thuwali]
MGNSKTRNDQAERAKFERRREEEGRGREAKRPAAIPARGWKDILLRVWTQMLEDRVTLTAAGVTFYILLAIFPALAAFVSIYGFVADPRTLADHIALLENVLPSGGLELIRSQLERLAGQDTDALSFGFIFGLAVALWSANKGIKALFEAMNIAYGETEKRGFVWLNVLTLAFTLGAIVIGTAFLVSLGVIPAVLAFLDVGGWVETLVRIARWPVMLVIIAVGITLIYRYGPSRETAQLPWLTWGAALATIVWLAASMAFSYYLENFANYNATYGTLGAAIGFLMWIWLSVVILLVGAELNSEMEHQTATDTTIGEPQPAGERGAVMADTLGRSADEES